MNATILAMTAVLGIRAHQRDEQFALVLGRTMLAVDRALAVRIPENPTAEQKGKLEAAAKILVAAGQDARTATWVEGRLQGERQTLENWLRDTHPEPVPAAEARRQIEFLGRVKYRIDAPR